MPFCIVDAPGLLSLSRLLAWCYLEGTARAWYHLSWESHPELHEFFRVHTFTAVIVDGMPRLAFDDETDPESDLAEELVSPVSDTEFLMSLALTMEQGERFQFPNDRECQLVTDRIVRRLRKIALRDNG